jgi:feruloyl esterase
MAIIDWVENGIAPESFVGTKWVNNTQALGVEFQREHCKFPKRNQYIDGRWQCVERED